jgi:hypothetical protein
MKHNGHGVTNHDLPDEWPEAHPLTGESFVDGHISTEHQPWVHRYDAPAKPTGEVAEWEACPCCGEERVASVRMMTPAELRKAQAEWREAYAEWKRTNGTLVLHGQSRTRGEFKTSSGAHAGGEYFGGKWRWDEFSHGPRPPTEKEDK